MPKHDVHIYAVVRVKVRGIEAPDPAEAARRAEKTYFPYLETYLRRTADGGFDHAEFSDEVSGYMVDVQGDKDFENTVFLTGDFKPDKKYSRGRPKAKGG